MKMLTYHHIVKKEHGGRTTVENGALLSAENHAWFNKQTKEEQDRMNKIFQEYKKCKVVFVDHVDVDFKIRIQEFSIKPDKGLMKTEFNRSEVKRETKKAIEDYYERNEER